MKEFPELYDFSPWPNFKRHEFVCSHTGFCRMDPEFLDWLQGVRTRVGFSFSISSGYRHITHPDERHKSSVGAHPQGVAVDIRCNGALAFLIVKEALASGVQGVGIQQKPGKAIRFVHLDMLRDPTRRPTMWSY